MKLPHHIAGVSVALALAACSGAQTGSTANAIPAVGMPQTTSITTATTPSVNKWTTSCRGP